MEEYKTLIEIVSELIEKGYTVDFSLLENTFQDLQKISSINISTNDFLIDEVHRCNDTNHETDEATFVFAISSKKNHFKGIVINALSNNDDNPSPLYNWYNKIKSAIFNLIAPIKPTDLNNNSDKEKINTNKLNDYEGTYIK